MTAIVGVLNSQGIAIAADSAVTVTGNNGKKVYNRSNKIFTLSKFHPVGIAIYNSADFMGMPLETIIKMYRKSLGESSFNTIQEYKDNFITFLRTQLVNVSPELRKSAFFGFCSEAHLTLINNTIDSLSQRNTELIGIEQPDKLVIYHEVVSEELEKYTAKLGTYHQANYTNLSFEQYCIHYVDELVAIEDFIQAEINKEFEGFILNEAHRASIKTMLYALVNIQFIFEKHCGLIFFGFGETEIYPSSHLVLVGSLIADDLRFIIGDPVKISPGVLNSNILPYAQGDVTTTVLTGVDPNYKNEVKQSVKSTFNDVSDQIAAILNNAEQSAAIRLALGTISDTLIQKLEEYQWTKITGPLLEILAHMGKEDMSELAESLVNITSLKRKFTSSNSADESVGGPVDVAIITKGDGFIWMKRKHYFDINNNQSFKDKYFTT
ncbi:hypothetical protein [Pedobacter sp. B4-66]|uniref:hypothetical protein n=1 Tax=Pedobacter sp. B4-66 TaxID=2817280 RepID=UPI001BDA3F76|nr:hypothetical protein [Pedobacter sp. B4-66]